MREWMGKAGGGRLPFEAGVSGRGGADELSVFWGVILSNLALWSEIAVFWGLILEKAGQKPDFWARTREIRPFLAAILPENANRVEITAQKAAIRRAARKIAGRQHPYQF